MINYKISKTAIKTIKSNDPNWNLISGYTITPRAGFEISSGCPYNNRQIIQECFSQGWLKPVAYMYDHELTFDLLKS